MNDNLADRVINRVEEDKHREQANIVGVWGFDESGFPWPNPVNSDAIVARIFSCHEKDSIFKIDNQIFVHRKKVLQNKSTLLTLCGRPKIVEWVSEPEYNKFWREVKRTISGEYPIIWARIIEIAPPYNRDYIRIDKNHIWGKNEADILLG